MQHKWLKFTIIEVPFFLNLLTEFKIHIYYAELVCKFQIFGKIPVGATQIISFTHICMNKQTA